MGARGIGHIRYLCDDRAAADRRGAQRRRRPRRRVRRPGGDRRGQGRAGRGAAGRTASRSSTPTTRWSRRWRPARRPGVVARRPRPGRATSAPRTSPLDDAAGPRSRWSPPDGRAPGRLRPARRAPGRATRSPRPPSASRLGMDLGRRSPPRCRRRGRAQPLADGGAPTARTASRSSTTPTTPTPTRCAPRSTRRWPRSQRGGRRWAVLGEMRELGEASAAEHDARRQAGRRPGHRPGWSSVGAGAPPIARRRRAARTAWTRSRRSCRDADGAVELLRGGAARRRRRAGQGLARRPGWSALGDARCLAAQTGGRPRESGPDRGRGRADHRAVRHPAVHPVPGPHGATGSSSATTARRRTTPSAARPRWAARSSSSRRWLGYVAAHLADQDASPTASGLLVLFLMTGLGLVGFLDDFIKICKQRSLGLRGEGQARRAARGRAVVRGAGAAVPKTPTDCRPASTGISFIRDTAVGVLRHRSAVRRSGRTS